MTPSRMRIAHLDETALSKLQNLEKEMGTVIVALEPQYQPADLTADQVHRLQVLERELGVVLLAYRNA